VATPALLEIVQPDVLGLVAAKHAEQLGVIPLGFLQPFPDSLAVAMIDPRDEAALEQIEHDTGKQVRPYVISELRALYYLEKLYGRRARPATCGRHPAVLSAPASAASPAAGRTGDAAGGAPGAAPQGPRADHAAGRGSRRRPDYAVACDRIDAARHRDGSAWRCSTSRSAASPPWWCSWSATAPWAGGPTRRRR
jgi:hypothetical protein